MQIKKKKNILLEAMLIIAVVRLVVCFLDEALG